MIRRALLGTAVLSLALFVTTDAEAWPGKKKHKKKRGSSEDTELHVDDAPKEELGGLLDEMLDEGTPEKADVPPPEGDSEGATGALETREAEELPDDEGIWAWVERMEDEIPTEEQVEAIREMSEEQSAEREVIENLVPESVSEDVYEEPEELVSEDPLLLDLVDPEEFDIPVEVNDEVRKWVAYFTSERGRKYYARWLSRSTRYVPMMQAELDEAGLPRDLIYLSMIESGFNAHAYSHAHAAGLWQFIPSTARLYKVRVDWWVDDRRDPAIATRAGIDYLSELYDMFGHWHLAWASYNGGPGRVRRAISRSGSKDFWTIARGDHLHRETDNYVPKIIAAAIIGKHPERYGFEKVEYQEPLEFEVAHVDGSVDLGVLAKCAGVSLDEFQHYNPALRRWATPPEGYEVRLPKGRQQAFVAALADVPVSKRVSFTKHKVGRGDTLGIIAGKYGVKVDDIVRANRLRDANRIYVGMSLVIPVGGSTPVASAPTPKPKTRSTKSAPARPTSHTVGKGDTLSGIASRYGLTTAQLRGWNGIRGDTIYVGQTLELKGSGGAAAPSSSKVVHKVGPGENLTRIAARYGVTVGDLQRWNGISNASKIFVGQKLSVHLPATSWTTYVVKPGDSLGKIAQKHGCTVKQIQSWNKLSGSVIHPGQKLKLGSG